MWKIISNILAILFCVSFILFVYVLITFEPDLINKDRYTVVLFGDGTYQIRSNDINNVNNDYNTPTYHLTKLKTGYVQNEVCKYRYINNKIYSYGLEKYVVTNIETEETIRSYYLEYFNEEDRSIFENLDNFISLCDNDYKSDKKQKDNTVLMLGDGIYQIIKSYTNNSYILNKCSSYTSHELCEYRIIGDKIYTIGVQSDTNRKYAVTNFIDHDYKDSEFIESKNLSDFSEEDRFIFEEHKDFIKLCDLN